MCISRGFALVCFIAFTLSGGARAAVDFDGARGAPPVRCLAAQLRDGGDAYRNCVPEDGTALGGVSFDERYAIESACVASDEPGRCVDLQLDALQKSPSPFLGALAVGDRNAILRQCFAVQGRDGVVAWGRCLVRSLEALEALPSPPPNALSAAERSEQSLACAADRRTAADFRRCRLEAVGVSPPALAAPAADATPAGEDVPDGVPTVAGERVTRRVTVPAELGPDGQTITAAAAPTAMAVAAADDDSDAQGVGDAGGAGNEADATDTNGARADDAGASDSETVVTPQATPATGAAEPLDATGSAPMDMRQRVDDGRERLLATVSGLEGTERIVLFAALALPLLLAGAWLLGRGAGEEDEYDDDPEVPRRNAALVDRVAPAMHRAGGTGYPDYDDDTSDEDFFADIEHSNGGSGPGASGPRARGAGASGAFASGSGERHSDDPDTRAARGAPRSALERDRAAFVALADNGRPDDRSGRTRGGPGSREIDPRVERTERIERTDRTDRTDRTGHAGHAGHTGHTEAMRPADVPEVAGSDASFGAWLEHREPPLRRQHAIEFMIYWMAYGDDRFDPVLAERLLRNGGEDGDPHDLVKRRVLEKDTAAFADVVRWLQASCSELERVQIIDLLMVLLVGDGAMTPVQNTLLHFLADAFGLGAEGLDQRHEEAFGLPMPSLARTDLPVWWEQLDPATPRLWDARTIATLDERAQQRIRLGLPLDGDLEDSRIVEAFRRAARRCQPHRFDALGERERALAERQFGKFEEARDRLLGVRA